MSVNTSPSLPPIVTDAVPSLELKAVEPRRPASFSAVVCKRCGNYRTVRAHRRSLLQRTFWVRLGYFPWKCLDCSHRFMSKDRGHR